MHEHTVGSLLRVDGAKVWKDYYADVDAIVFLVDSVDRERFPESKRELDVRLCPSLVCARRRYEHSQEAHHTKGNECPF